MLRDFVAALTNPGPSGQLARWSGICPTVLGMQPAQASFMMARIREAAAPLRLDREPSNCRPTTIVVVTPNASVIAAEFAATYPAKLKANGQWRLRQFARSTLPVRWLAVSDPCGRAGCRMLGSRLNKATAPTLQLMIVIVDAERIADFRLGEVSDYVAMVALSNPPLGPGQPGSILAMFNSPRPIDARFVLTPTDQSFLAGLYRSNPATDAQQQRSTIATAIRRDRKTER